MKVGDISSRLLIFAKQTGLDYAEALQYFVFSVFSEVITFVFTRGKQCIFP